MSGPGPGAVGYLTVATGSFVQAELEVKRSRFLAVLRRADSAEAARQAIAAQRRQFHDARHHCSAFVVGEPTGSGAITRSSDDGEPAGTAGLPILQVLLGSALGDVVVVVTRWFGGTLLGAGGLVRAYSGATALAVQAARDDRALLRRRRVDLATVTVEHAVAGRVEAELRARGVVIRSVDYGLAATLTVVDAGERAAHEGTDRPSPALIATVAAITAGTGVLAAAGHAWSDRPVT